MSGVLQDPRAHFASLTSIQHLELQANHVDAVGAEALAPSLPSLKSLLWLDNLRNHIGDEGINALVYDVMWQWCRCCPFTQQQCATDVVV